ncbi:GNAT family N-acetyltransferase [Actinokineospora sp. NPDC004072]
MTELVRAHNRRMQAIDPAIAPAAAPAGAALTTTRTAAAWVRSHRYPQDSPEALWGALCRHTIHLLVSAPAPADEVDTLLQEALAHLRSHPDHGRDCAVALTWPSMDTALPGPLLRRGFAPITALAMRRIDDPEPGPAARPATIRRAEPADLPWLVGHAERLHRLETDLGALPHRPNPRGRLHAELAAALGRDLLLVAADRTGFIHGQRPQGAWVERQVAVGPAGYLSRLYVDAPARRRSTGRSLVAAAHGALRAHGAQAVLLHHSIHNPIAAPMWARFGYRPVYTTWRRRLR